MSLSYWFSRCRGALLIASVWLALNAALLAWMNLDEGGARRGRSIYRPSSRARQLYLSGENLPLFTGGESAESPLAFRLLKPPERSCAALYPLVVFLHGAGERGSDNEHQLKGFPEQMVEPEWHDRFPCFLLAPQCPENSHWSEWMPELERLVMQLCDNLPVDRRRVYLTGLSMGGFGSWELAARRPELFAAVAPICGGGSVADAEKLKDLPLWAIHGDADRVVSVRYTREMITAIQRAGGQPHYSELPGVGHNSWTAAYRDVDGLVPWMFSQFNEKR